MLGIGEKQDRKPLRPCCKQLQNGEDMTHTQPTAQNSVHTSSLAAPGTFRHAPASALQDLLFPLPRMLIPCSFTSSFTHAILLAGPSRSLSTPSGSLLRLLCVLSSQAPPASQYQHSDCLLSLPLSPQYPEPCQVGISRC